MKNWKTTLGGIMAAAGTYLVNAHDGWLDVIGQVLSAVGLLLLGSQAKDKNIA